VVVRGLENSALDDREKTLFRFVEKVHHRAQQLTAQDMQPMYAAGWDDEAIYYVITICALFNFYDRWVGASRRPRPFGRSAPAGRKAVGRDRLHKKVRNSLLPSKRASLGR